MKRHFLPVATLATMMLVGMVLPVYAAENQENEETITRIVVSEKEVQDISSSFLALATEGEAVQTAKTKIAAKEKAKKEEELKKKQAEALKIESKKMLDDYQSKATAYPSGIKLYVVEKGAGIKPTEGENIRFDYAGYLADGTLFDTGIEALAEKHGIFNPQRKAANAYQQNLFFPEQFHRRQRGLGHQFVA